MITLVVTEGGGSLDLYSQELAGKLDVPKVYTNIYQKIAERFNISWFSWGALEAIWANWHFVRMLKRLDGIVHLPSHHLGRYGCLIKIPYIITVHDLIRYFDLKGYETYIHPPNSRDRFYLSRDYQGVTKAMRIIAVSECTKRDLIDHLGIPEERISVIYEGVDHSVFKPVAQRYLEYPYILYVGSEHPRKNFSTLLRAFGKLKGEEQFRDLKLVKVGKAGGREVDFRGRTIKVINTLGLTEEVILLDYAAEDELPVYYSGAECFILPSLYEGFGLTLVEAMACGCPAVISDCASLPEVAGGAALEVDPHDADVMAGALKQVLTNQELRKKLVAKGIEQAAKFSWGRTARETGKVYRDVEASLTSK